LGLRDRAPAGEQVGQVGGPGLFHPQPVDGGTQGLGVTGGRGDVDGGDAQGQATGATGTGSSDRPTLTARSSAVPKPAAGARSRNGLPGGTAPLTVSAASMSAQNVGRSLSVPCTLNQATTGGSAPSARDAAQSATVDVLPEPGPALTRVTGRVAPRANCSCSRGRCTSPVAAPGCGGRSRNRTPT